MAIHDEAFLQRAAAAKERVPQLPAEDLAERVAAAAHFIDVREPEEVAGGSLSGAVNIPLGSLAQRITAAIPDRSAPIVCFCAGGNRGSLAAAELLDLGYTNVSSIVGGLQAVDALHDAPDKATAQEDAATP